jgi:metallo-beta-lactamase class B
MPAFRFNALLLATLLVWGQASQAQTPERPRVQGGVGLLPLTPAVMIHTSFKDFNHGSIPANGLVLDTEEGLVLIDATWDAWRAGSLAKQLQQAYHKPVRYLLLTSAHEDRMGGLIYWQRAGVRVICHQVTANELVARGFAAPDLILAQDTVLLMGQTRIEVCFPGAGHTPDNLAVWLPEAQVLFGGGLVRSATTRGPGDTADADLAGWKAALEILHDRYLSARIVVPGIGPYGGANLIKHSHNIVVREMKRE